MTMLTALIARVGREGSALDGRDHAGLARVSESSEWCVERALAVRGHHIPKQRRREHRLRSHVHACGCSCTLHGLNIRLPAAGVSHERVRGHWRSVRRASQPSEFDSGSQRKEREKALSQLCAPQRKLPKIHTYFQCDCELSQSRSPRVGRWHGSQPSASFCSRRRASA